MYCVGMIISLLSCLTCSSSISYKLEGRFKGLIRIHVKYIWQEYYVLLLSALHIVSHQEVHHVQLSLSSSLGEGVGGSKNNVHQVG